MSLAAQPRERAPPIPDERPAEVVDDADKHSSSSIPFSSSPAPPSCCTTNNSQQQDLPSTEKHNKQHEDSFDAASRTESDKDDTDSDRSSISGASTYSSGATTPPQTFPKENTETTQEPANGNKDEMLAVRNFSLSSSSTPDLLSAGGSAPSLPAKSSLRTSRLLASMPQKKQADDEQPMLPHAAPHQMYLSSEEDASSSADDFSDFDDAFDSDSESSGKSLRKGSHEDIARVVSVVFSGKPSVITLTSRRTLSTSSSLSSQNGGSLPHTSTEPMLSRNRAFSTASSLSSLFHHPPRSTSMAAAKDRKRPAFLSIDPHAHKADADTDSARTPKTPTTMFRKTFGLVKKRSKQTLNGSESAFAPSVMQQVGEEDEYEEHERQGSVSSSDMPRPATYQDIMKAARKNAAAATPRSEHIPASPMSPRTRIRSGLSLGRQKSLSFRA